MEEREDAFVAAEADAPHPRTLPRWADLPDFDLYMDQVISLMERYLSPPVGAQERPLTASMVNNYVKCGLVPAPVKKRYARVHLASLIVVCVMKPVLPLSTIAQVLASHQGGTKAGAAYDAFCERFEEAEREAADVACAQPTQSPLASVVSAALGAQAYRNIALSQASRLTSGDDDARL